MLTVSTELQPILNGIVQFISYMALAVFAENVILARALGVTRLMKLVPDHRAQVGDFCLPLLLVITLSAPAGWAAHDLFFPWLRDYLPAWLPISALRPIVYLTCGIAAMAMAWLLLGVLPRKLRASCRSQLSLATCSTEVAYCVVVYEKVFYCTPVDNDIGGGYRISLPVPCRRARICHKEQSCL